jgi:hypothetical protein
MQMNIRGGQEGMDTRVNSSFERLPGSLDVGVAAASQSGDHGPANLAGHKLHRVKIAFGGNGESGLDYIYAQAIELTRHAEFLVRGHAASRRLLAIAQCSVEYLYLFCSCQVFLPLSKYNLLPAKTKRPSSVVDDGPY